MFIKYILHALSITHFAKKPSLLLISVCLCTSHLPILLLFCRFISCYLFLSRVSVHKRGGMRSDAFFHSSVHIQQMQRGRKVEKGDGGGGVRETGPYYFCVEAADDTLMNLDHSRSPTQSYIHASTHTIYATLLIAPLLFPTTTLCSYFQCVRTQHLQMSYLHHCCRQS